MQKDNAGQGYRQWAAGSFVALPCCVEYRFAAKLLVSLYCSSVLMSIVRYLATSSSSNGSHCAIFDRLTDILAGPSCGRDAKIPVSLGP